MSEKFILSHEKFVDGVGTSGYSFTLLWLEEWDSTFTYSETLLWLEPWET